MNTREQQMEELLLEIHERGGLGVDTHERILEVLGPKNGKFCREPRLCLATGFCMNAEKHNVSCLD